MLNGIISQKNIDIIRKEVSQWSKWKRDSCNIPDDIDNTATNNQTEVRQMAQLDKPIIHFQIPLIPYVGKGCAEDRFAISMQEIEFFMRHIKAELRDKAYLLATPFDIKTIGVEGENVELEPKTLTAFLKQLGYKDGTEE